MAATAVSDNCVENKSSVAKTSEIYAVYFHHHHRRRRHYHYELEVLGVVPFLDP
jgi:hypothetical protein